LRIDLVGATFEKKSVICGSKKGNLCGKVKECLWEIKTSVLFSQNQIKKEAYVVFTVVAT
jgi:hypothetical protein